MRWLCDRMLERLARWLRAAGHDAASAPAGASDADLLQLAQREGRTLLTRDRELAARACEAVLIEGDDGADAEALDLGRKRPALDWSLARFTRCLMDNAPLRPASPEDVARMPGRAQALEGPFRICPACWRLYWPGSHVKRMSARLDRFAAARAPDGGEGGGAGAGSGG
jgi:uncharacterized protein with PIN domain